MFKINKIKNIGDDLFNCLIQLISWCYFIINISLNNLINIFKFRYVLEFSKINKHLFILKNQDAYSFLECLIINPNTTYLNPNSYFILR